MATKEQKKNDDYDDDDEDYGLLKFCMYKTDKTKVIAFHRIHFYNMFIGYSVLGLLNSLEIVEEEFKC